MNELVQRILEGDRRALARLLTHVENQREGVEQALAVLFPRTGRAWVVGITGAPGTGKSTLVTEIAKIYRAQGETVAILAVDPTSPFTGGALLGDRVRMQALSGDSGVFIRSMATRGSLGGLARATRDAVRVLDAAGFSIILVETVGAGQNEVDIVRAAHTTIVVEAPGMGDEVQAIKAGILEIADVLVVNKADRQGVNQTVRALRLMLELGHPAARTQVSAHHGRLIETQPHAHPAEIAEAVWLPPLVQTVASEGRGVAEVVDAIAAHRQFLANTALHDSIERQHIEIELYDRLREALVEQLLQQVPEASIATVIDRVQSRDLDPHAAVRLLLKQG